MDWWILTLFVLIILLVGNYTYRVAQSRLSNHAIPLDIEGFETTNGFQEDVYDEFYATVYNKIFQHDNLIQAEAAVLMTEWARDKDAEFVKQMRILDVCCGTGVATCAFAKKGIDKAVGLDKAVAMLNYAKDKVQPSTTLTDDQQQVIEWRNGDAYAPMAAQIGEFTNACLLYFSVYYFKDLDTLFKNLAMWVKPGGGLAIEVVNKHKFEPVPDVANPWIAVSPQKHSKERIMTSKAVFDKFEYETEFELFDPRAEFRETFKFNDGKVRKQKHSLYMPSIEKIIHTAAEMGWRYDKYMDLQFTGFNYGYMLFFTRIVE